MMATGNILELANYGIETKTFTTDINKYNQTHCQCTMTDDGFRIYRTPNLVYPEDGSVMWGGLCLYPMNANSNCLVKGHTYVLMFDVKGKSSGAARDVTWSNNIGWGGGGLSPTPSNVDMVNPVTANFNSSEWKTFSYKWTINDDVYKVCTSSYSRFVSGTTYLSYNGFKFGFSYANTGEMGTDLYIKNLRMYDITGQENSNTDKDGTFHSGNFNENLNTTDTAKVFKYGEVRANDFIEK